MSADAMSKESLWDKFDRVVDQLQYWEKQQRPILHEIAEKGEFRTQEVILSTAEKGAGLIKMKRIGSRDGEIFFYDPATKEFYSSVGRLKQKRGTRHYWPVTLLWKGNISWHRLAKLMHSDTIRKMTKKL